MGSFAWFDLRVDKVDMAKAFYSGLLGWQPSDLPDGGSAFLAGDAGPWAGISMRVPEGPVGWIPFVEVDDVDASTQKAETLGATVLNGKTEGPAGVFAVIEDPAGGVVALWQRG